MAINFDLVFQFLLGCYGVRGRQGQDGALHLSIPFRMLLVGIVECMLYVYVLSIPFRMLRVPAHGPPFHTLVNFQFLLGCYRGTSIQVKPRPELLSIPFRMLQDVRRYMVSVSYISFQFLLGCYVWVGDNPVVVSYSAFNSF